MASDVPRDVGGPPATQENTGILLGRIRAGDRRAREALFARYLPVLKRWAHQRLPSHSRDMRDTDDLVQDTLIRAFGRLDTFEHRGEGAFLAYLRQILLNAIRDEVRSAVARPRREPLEESVPQPGPSVIEEVIGRERLERFERALLALEPKLREAIILRIEFGFSHQQVAEAIGKPTADAARMTVSRALVQLAREMNA